MLGRQQSSLFHPGKGDPGDPKSKIANEILVCLRDPVLLNKVGNLQKTVLGINIRVHMNLGLCMDVATHMQTYLHTTHTTHTHMHTYIIPQIPCSMLIHTTTCPHMHHTIYTHTHTSHIYTLHYTHTTAHTQHILHHTHATHIHISLTSVFSRLSVKSDKTELFLSSKMHEVQHKDMTVTSVGQNSSIQ